MRKTESGSDLRSLSASEKERERQRPLQREREEEWDAPPVDTYTTQPPKKGGRRQQQQQQQQVNPPWASDQFNGNEYESHPPPQQQNRRVGEARQQYATQAQRDEPIPSARNNQPPGRVIPKSQLAPSQRYLSLLSFRDTYPQGSCPFLSR